MNLPKKKRKKEKDKRKIMLFISVLTSRGHSRALVIAILSLELSQQRECKLYYLLRSGRYLVLLKPKHFTSETELLRVGRYEWQEKIQAEEEKSNQCAGDREQREKVKANWEGRDGYIC